MLSRIGRILTGMVIVATPAFGPQRAFMVVKERIQANKEFDLITLPKRSHGRGNEAYIVGRRWDYFVKNLWGAAPPKDCEMRPPNNQSS